MPTIALVKVLRVGILRSEDYSEDPEDVGSNHGRAPMDSNVLKMVKKNIVTKPVSILIRRYGLATKEF